ncbi:MAG: glucose PTS transporter subunit IIA, partial [Turicibacter sp.]
SSAGFSALVAGITEPAMYGVTVRLKKPMLAACLASGTAGIFAGIMKLKGFGVATPALVTLVQYVDANNSQNIIIAIMTAVITIVLSFVLTLVIGFEDPIEETEEMISTTMTPLTTAETISSPMEGVIIPLTDVSDNTFSSEALGKGIAIVPTKGQVVAPFDGTIEAFFNTHHAIGLKSNSGIEVLIHVGLETVNLKGKYFTPKAKMGDRVKKGDLLLEFDFDKLIEEGYETVTPIVITNTNQYLDVIGLNALNINLLDDLLSIV